MAVIKVQPGSINAPLGSLQESGVNAFGGVNILEINFLSSDVPISTSPINIAMVSGGDIYIEDIEMDTDATGLAAGTTFEVLTDDTLGLAAFVTMAVSSLGASTSHSMFGTTPWTVGAPRVIGNGMHLQLGSTSAACTGAGKCRMVIKYRPLLQTAVLQ